ncbi:MAG: leucine-rich repeat protein [Ferruginibacter sp.]
MTDKAHARILKEMKFKTGALDLGRCMLTEMPEELLKMDWLTHLSIKENLLSEIKNLDALARLHSLDLSINKLSKINNLDALSNLQTLDLSSNQISGLENLDALVNLQSLDLSSNQISELKNLGALVNLQTIHLGSNGIDRIKGLDAQSNKLQKLDLGSNLISVIENLDVLARLQSLDLVSNQIDEIKNLDALTNLQTLNLGSNQIREMKNLGSLTNLKMIILSDNQIREIGDIDTLINLHSLYLHANQISKIENLNNLSLERIDLSNNPINTLQGLYELTQLPKLIELRLFGFKTNDFDIPSENFGTYFFFNCLEPLRNYFNSIEKDSFRSKELPVILVGNSTSGKTSLRYFLQQNVFPPAEDYSTHGIEPSIWKPGNKILEKFDKNRNLKDIQFYFWDFGGQEYYHSTHRLFFSKKAIYILVWEQKTNRESIETLIVRKKNFDNTIEEKVLDVELFPNDYWIYSIRNQVKNSNESPIIMVQNKIDQQDNKGDDEPVTALVKKINCTELQLSILEANRAMAEGKDYRRFSIFLEVFFEAAEVLSSTMVDSPLWEKIKERVQQLRNENILKPSEFLKELRELDPGMTEETMRYYLERLRAMRYVIYEYDDAVYDEEKVYKDDELLKYSIFVNPGWVTEMIYAILDDKVRDKNGEFDRDYVLQIVGDKADLFIALMKKFELIFEYEAVFIDKTAIGKNQLGEKAGENQIQEVKIEIKTLVAPQYLPEFSSDKMKEVLSSRIKADPDFRIRFKDFMPRYIMLRFLTEYGPKAEAKYYWKYGIFFVEDKCGVLVQCDYMNKQFLVYTEHVKPNIQKLVFEVLVRLSENVDALQVACGSEDFVPLTSLQREFKDGEPNSNIISENGRRISLSVFKHLFEKIEAVPINTQKINDMESGSKKIKVFISYAHVDEKIKELFEEKYLKAIQHAYKGNLEVFSDKNIKPGAPWNDKINYEIDSADIMIVFLTNGFITSDYIKEIEIKKSLERNMQKKLIIVPIYIEKIAPRLKPFSDLQYLPGEKPVKEWRPQSDAWVKIQDGLFIIIDDIKKGNTTEYYTK